MFLRNKFKELKMRRSTNEKHCALIGDRKHIARFLQVETNQFVLVIIANLGASEYTLAHSEYIA